MGRKAQTPRVNWHVSSLVSRSAYVRAITSTVTMDDDLGLDQKWGELIFVHTDCVAVCLKKTEE